MTYPPAGDSDPNRPQPPYGQPGSDPANPYGPYGQHTPPGHGPHGQHPAEAHGAEPYSQYGPYGGVQRGTNVMAVLALVFAFVFAPAGIVLGHLAKKQIRETGEQGQQLAQWGMILSYVFTALGLAACCAWIGVLFWAGSNDTNY